MDINDSSQCLKRYAIIFQGKILKYFKDPVEAIKVNRVEKPLGSKVVKIETDGTFILLAENKKNS